MCLARARIAKASAMLVAWVCYLEARIFQCSLDARNAVDGTKLSMKLPVTLVVGLCGLALSLGRVAAAE